MKDEIKEILDKLNNKAEHYILYDYEVKQLLDYITNLEKENKKLLKKSYSDDVIITKATKMVKENLMGIGYVEASKLLDILQGSDE